MSLYIILWNMHLSEKQREVFGFIDYAAALSRVGRENAVVLHKDNG